VREAGQETPGCHTGRPGSGRNAGIQFQDHKAFNNEVVAFNACIKAYVDNAQNDINTIQVIVHAAVAEANAEA
jgi:hypothetical protein